MEPKTYDELLALIDRIDPVAYAKTRNHLTGAVTRLSPYISRGVLTLPVIRDRLLARHAAAACEKLIQELAWREYFQNVWWEKGEEIFADLRFPRSDWRHHELVTAIIEGTTGVDVLDAAVRELTATGYAHNHVRMWLASVAVNLAGAHWFPMGRWLYYHLADGDLASNFLSWQWVAGTSVNKRYTVNQELINACSGSRQVRSILDYPRDAMLTQSVPEVLRAHQPFDLQSSLPTSDEVSVAKETVHLFTPWTLDPTWRAQETAVRVLVIDPVLFARFPVSPAIMQFMVAQGRAVLPELRVFVGDPRDIPGIETARGVFARAHQTNQHWPAVCDAPLRLFPAVTGYYPSFFAYWQAVTKAYPVTR
jgi:deoxyribodipyrimidine photo-lyase